MNHQLYIARRENKIKQKEIAKKIGMHEQTYARKERGELDFTIKEGVLLTKIFNCSLNDLFGGENT